MQLEICQRAEALGAPNRTETRCVIDAHPHTLDDEGLGLPPDQPDFIIADIAPGSTSPEDPSEIKRRQCPSFVGVKCKVSDDPEPYNYEKPNLPLTPEDAAEYYHLSNSRDPRPASYSPTPLTPLAQRSEKLSTLRKTILAWQKTDATDEEERVAEAAAPDKVKKPCAKAADYAGWVFAGRPFQVFVIGVFVFNRYFRVSVSDRGGMVYSRKYDIADDLRLFVAVLQKLTCFLDARDLGRDPCVELKEGHHYYQQQYPIFYVSLGESSYPTQPSRVYMTQGAPIFTSYSLMGRGTSVWRCKPKEGGPGAVVILKSSWRLVKRQPERVIYSRIPPRIESTGEVRRGIAYIKDGGNVMFPAFVTEPTTITVNHMRKRAGLPLYALTRHDSVLDRIVLSVVGKPLWEFATVGELLLALKAIVGGKYLFV